MRKAKTLYAAYGSNLNIEQMKMRCPTAQPIAKTCLPDYRLVFQGMLRGAHANIIPAPGESVPLVIWEISAADEKALDRYEGVAGGYYTKEYLRGPVNGKQQDILIYIMTPHDHGIPNNGYLATIVQGYADFDLDVKILNAGLRYSTEKAKRREKEELLWN